MKNCYNERVFCVVMTASKVFQKRVEDFSCEQCGFFVEGNGFTNHCPRCLYSKHVDIFPGDRQETCGGLMEALAAEQIDGQTKLLHQCVRCGKQRKNKVQSGDEFESLLGLARRRASEGS